MTDVEALFEHAGDAFVATPRTIGPWDPNAQSGGAVLSLLGHVLDGGSEGDGFMLSRLTVDMVRPAPVGERLWVDVDVLHGDDATRTIDLIVRSEAVATTRGRARLVRGSGELIGTAGTGDGASPPDELVDVGLHPEAAPFLKLGAEMRRSADPTGPSHVVWCRLRVPVVAGETIRPTSRAVLPFDLVNKIGAPLVRDAASTINPDVSGHIARPPVGEWVRLSGNSYYDHKVGHGISMATLSDDLGDFGVTSTSQLIEPLDA